jgi:site-specific recombinase XerD
MLKPVLKSKLGEPSSVPKTLPDLFDEYATFAHRVRDLAKETINQQLSYIDRFLTSQSIPSPNELFLRLSPTYVQQFVFDYADEYGPGSRRSMQVSLRSFLKFCRHQGYTSRDLSTAVPTFRTYSLKSVPKNIDDETISLLLESIDTTSPIGRRDFALIQILNAYGVRGNQVRYLRFDHIHWQNNTIQFLPSKGGKAISQHLTTHVGNSLIAYIRDGRPKQAPYPEVFLTSRPPFHPFKKGGSFSNIIARCLQRAGIELPQGVSRGTHSFRHAFGTRLAGRVPLKHIADMLGHRDISSSFIYCKVDFDALREATLPWPQEV